MKLVDVNIGPRTVALLRDAGLDALRVGDDVPRSATNGGAVAYQSARGAVDAERVARLIVSVINATRADLEAGAIVTGDDASVRVRRLPIV
jgi:predicted nuclease of predicted toxin-antitoxin system